MKNNPFVCSCMNACVWCESFTGMPDACSEQTLVLVWFRLVSSGLSNVNTVSALWRMHKWNDAKSVEKIPEIILSSQSPASAHIKTAQTKWINIEQNWSRSDRNKTCNTLTHTQQIVLIQRRWTGSDGWAGHRHNTHTWILHWFPQRSSVFMTLQRVTSHAASNQSSMLENRSHDILQSWCKLNIKWQYRKSALENKFMDEICFNYK